MPMFDKQDTYDQVVAVIAQKLNVDVQSINATSTLQDLGADSLDLVEIIMKLEDRFGVEINDEEAEKLCNVQDVVDYVHAIRSK